MRKGSTESENLAATIAHLYIDAVDNNRDRLLNCLHPDTILDWFGRTIQGNMEIISFFSTFPHTIHYIHSAEACEPIDHRSKKSYESDDYEYSEEFSDDPEDVNKGNTADNLIKNCLDNENNNNKSGSNICNQNAQNVIQGKPPLKRLSSSPIDNTMVNPVTNMVNTLAGFNQVVLGSITNLKLPRLTPYGNVNLVVVPSQLVSNSNERKAVIVKGNLYMSSKSQSNHKALWERKLKHIVIEYDSVIRLIVYEGASNCRKNLSLLFDNM